MSASDEPERTVSGSEVSRVKVKVKGQQTLTRLTVLCGPGLCNNVTCHVTQLQPIKRARCISWHDSQGTP